MPSITAVRDIMEFGEFGDHYPFIDYQNGITPPREFNEPEIQRINELISRIRELEFQQMQISNGTPFVVNKGVVSGKAEKNKDEDVDAFTFMEI